MSTNNPARKNGVVLRGWGRVSASLLIVLAGCGSDHAAGGVPCEGLDPFYAKCMVRNDVLVAGAAEVSDAALEATLTLVEGMTAKRPDVRERLYEAGIFTAVLGDAQQTTDIPEYARLADDPTVDWNTRARGFGSAGPNLPTLVAEEDVLCLAGDKWDEESVAVHEFAHTFFDEGIARGPDGAEYQSRLSEAYRAAVDAGRWAGTYAATNSEEYWATGVQLYFDAIDRLDINGRDELAAYDPALAALVEELMPEAWVYACPD